MPDSFPPERANGKSKSDKFERGPVRADLFLFGNA
jgi:hypothetical protein